MPGIVGTMMQVCGIRSDSNGWRSGDARSDSAELLFSPSSEVSSDCPMATEVTKELRDRLLNSAPADFGITPDGSVWGILMEMAYPQGTATLIALANGSASIYFSSGGGVIGGTPHENINAATKHFVRLARDFVPEMPSTTKFPLPSVGCSMFYVLTTAGVVSFEAAEKELSEGNHRFSPLFFAGHEVITGLRLISERPTS